MSFNAHMSFYGFLVRVIVLVALSSCQPSKRDFTGAAGGSRPSTPEEKKAPTQPDTCTSAKLQSTRSITSIVDQNRLGEILLELKFLPCRNQTKQIDVTLQLDFENPTFSLPPHNGLSYDITTNGVAIVGSTPMRRIAGQDLFGKSGIQYDHFKSEKSVSINSDIEVATIRIKMGDFRVARPSTTSAINTAEFSTPAYFKIGETEPVSLTLQFTAAGGNGSH